METRPNQIIAHFSQPNETKEKVFTFCSQKLGGYHEGAIYQDEQGVRWLFKPSNPVDAAREVMASQVYRSLVGEKAAPEVQLIARETPQKWIVASRWCDGLEACDFKANGMEKMICASFIIRDVDCVPKNIGSKSRNVFRFDFGSALQITEKNQQELKEIVSVYQFYPWLCPLSLDKKILSSIIESLKMPSIDQTYWQSMYEKALDQQKLLDPTLCTTDEESLNKQFIYIAERIHFLKSLVKNAEIKEMSHKNVLFNSLLDFYHSLEYYIQPLMPNFAVVMAKRHLEHYQEYKEHPFIYQSFVKQAKESIEHVNFCKKIGLKANDMSEQYHFNVLIQSKQQSIEKLLQTPLAILVSRKTLTSEELNNVINNYTVYKNKYFGVRWLRTSSQTAHIKQVLMQAKDDADRYQLAEQYVAENPTKTFANELRKTL